MTSFHIISLFPQFFESPLGESMLKRAQEKGLIAVRVTNPRDFAPDKHHIVDDTPFGGGGGMVLKPAPIVAAIEAVRNPAQKGRTILLTPQGIPFTQEKARELSLLEEIVLVCGRYEGIDERVRYFVDEEVSIGDYVLSGGEAAALVILEAVARLIPGVLGNEDSVREDSFYDGLLDFPAYTKPRDFRGHRVPEILLSGDHRKIMRWRRREAVKRTLERRPELLSRLSLEGEDQEIVEELEAERS